MTVTSQNDLLKALAHEHINKCKDMVYGEKGREAANKLEGDYGSWRDWEARLILFGRELMKTTKDKWVVAIDPCEGRTNSGLVRYFTPTYQPNLDEYGNFVPGEAGQKPIKLPEDYVNFKKLGTVDKDGSVNPLRFKKSKKK